MILPGIGIFKSRGEKFRKQEPLRASSTIAAFSPNRLLKSKRKILKHPVSVGWLLMSIENRTLVGALFFVGVNSSF